MRKCVFWVIWKAIPFNQTISCLGFWSEIYCCCCLKTCLSSQSTGVDIEGCQADTRFWLPDVSAWLIYQYSIKTVMRYMLCMHQHTTNEMQRSLQLLFNWNGSVTLHHITLARVHILNRIQLAEHWGGILCKCLITSVHDWIQSVNSQSPARIQPRIFHVSVRTRTLMRTIMLHLLTMSVSVQTSSIKNVKLLKAHSNGAKLLCFLHRLGKRQIINLFRSSTSGCLSRVKLLFLVWKH